MFDKDKANEHLNKFLKIYKIKVIRWSASSSGYANPVLKEVKIPKPTDVDMFCVCMHEIKHIIDGKWGRLYQREYACEKFAIEQAESLGFNCQIYKERARRYVIMAIAKGHCRKPFDFSKLEPEIYDFCKIDFSEWENKKVFVSGWGVAVKKNEPLIIEFKNKS